MRLAAQMLKALAAQMLKALGPQMLMGLSPGACAGHSGGTAKPRSTSSCANSFCSASFAASCFFRVSLAPHTASCASVRVFFI